METPTNHEKERARARLAQWRDKNSSKAKYPFEMVLEARKMRRWRFTYTEIADALNDHYGTNVHWITVRDWTCHYGRMLR